MADRILPRKLERHHLMKPIYTVFAGLPLILFVVFFNTTPQPAAAQTIQLPNYSVFGVGTTVNVPDGGSVLLGGVSRAGYQSASRSVPGLGGLPGAGPLFRNRGIGSSVGHSSARAYVRIIDLAEMDRAVLAEAARRRHAREAASARETTAGRAEAKLRSESLVSGGGRSGVARDRLSGNSQPSSFQSKDSRQAASPLVNKAKFLSRNVGRSSR